MVRITRRAAEPSLRPVRWPAVRRRGALLRLGLVAVLLLLAAATLSGQPAEVPCAPAAAGASAPPSTPPAGGRPGMPAPQGAAGTRPPTGTGELPAGTVGVPVRLAEPAALAVVRPGARVDLLSVTSSAGGRPLLVAPRALVLGVLAGPAAEVGGALYLALPAEQADRVVSQPEGARFAIVVRD